MENEMLVEMGRRLSSRRKELGITQEHLAEQMDVSIQMISNMELGKKAIRPKNLVKVCDILNISTDYALKGNKSTVEINELSRRIKNLSLRDIKIVENMISTMESI